MANKIILLKPSEAKKKRCPENTGFADERCYADECMGWVIDDRTENEYKPNRKGYCGAIHKGGLLAAKWS